MHRVRLGERGDAVRFRIQATSWVGKAFALAGMAVMLVVAFVFSIVVLAVVAVVALAVGGYLWWRLRRLRRQVAPSAASARVIEGEFTSEDVREQLGNSPSHRTTARDPE